MAQICIIGETHHSGQIDLTTAEVELAAQVPEFGTAYAIIKVNIKGYFLESTH